MKTYCFVNELKNIQLKKMFEHREPARGTSVPSRRQGILNENYIVWDTPPSEIIGQGGPRGPKTTQTTATALYCPL